MLSILFVHKHKLHWVKAKALQNHTCENLYIKVLILVYSLAKEKINVSLQDQKQVGLKFDTVKLNQSVNLLGQVTWPGSCRHLSWAC